MGCRLLGERGSVQAPSPLNLLAKSITNTSMSRAPDGRLVKFQVLQRYCLVLLLLQSRTFILLCELKHRGVPDTRILESQPGILGGD